MGTFERARRIVQANLNHLLDTTSPERELTEAVLKIGRVRGELRSALAALSRQKTYLARRRRESGAAVAKWQARAELAVRHGKDDLAREALHRRREEASAHDRAVDELKQTLENMRSVRASLAALNTKLDRARRLRASLATRGVVVPSSSSTNVGLLEAAALAELSVDPLEERFRDLERRDLDRELEQMKRQLGSGS